MSDEPLPPACMDGVCDCPSMPDGYPQHEQPKRPYVLLCEDRNGDLVAVRFTSQEEARDWEDANEARLIVRGCVRVVSKKEVLT